MIEAAYRLTRLVELAGLEHTAEIKRAEGWFKGSSVGNKGCMFSKGKIDGIKNALNLAMTDDNGDIRAKLRELLDRANQEYDRMVERVGNDHSGGNRECNFLNGKRIGAKDSLDLVQNEIDSTTEVVNGYIYKIRNVSCDRIFLAFIGLLPKKPPLEIFIGQMQDLELGYEKTGMNPEIVKKINGTRLEIFRAFLEEIK